MSTTAKNPDIPPIPVPLAETEFNAFIFPYLSMPKRGPKCKLGYHMTKPFYQLHVARFSIREALVKWLMSG
jgi:hypothetical protein